MICGNYLVNDRNIDNTFLLCVFYLQINYFKYVVYGTCGDRAYGIDNLQLSVKNKQLF